MRKWTAGLAPKAAHDALGMYDGGIWMKKMDRFWYSDDGYSAMSRLIQTDWGKIEHVAINRMGPITFNGEKDIPWKIKQEIKDELFGKNRVAIEVFPAEKNLIDAADTYHLWVFEKGFKLPFGIHPKDEQGKTVHRGCLRLDMVINNVPEMQQTGDNT